MFVYLFVCVLVSLYDPVIVCLFVCFCFVFFFARSGFETNHSQKKLFDKVVPPPKARSLYVRNVWLIAAAETKIIIHYLRSPGYVEK